jgi:CheY-like chemotaxis protein
MTNTVSVLIADDNDDNREIFALALESYTSQIDFAVNGQVAMDKLHQKKYDLLLLDLNMPVMNGLEVLNRVRADELLKQLVVVVVTANPHMATDHIQDIADWVLYKPIDVREFASLIDRIQTQKSAGVDLVSY